MTRDEERLRRFDLAIDLQWAAKAAGFNGISLDTWRFTERGSMDAIERLRKQRMEYARKLLTERGKNLDARGRAEDRFGDA